MLLDEAAGSYGGGNRDHPASAPVATTFTQLCMLVFGIVVVLLLLNLLSARFAKTFDIVHEHVDSHFKLEFARIVLVHDVKGLGEARDQQVEQQQHHHDAEDEHA